MVDGVTPAVEAALQGRATDWLYALRIELDDGDHFFVADTRKRQFDGITYNQASHARISNLTTKTGDVSNRITITVDGALVKTPDAHVSKVSWFSGLVARKLVNRDLDLFLLHRDVLSGNIIGRTFEFAGFVHSAKITANNIGEPDFVIEGVSWRTKMRKGPIRVYSPTDQESLHPTDTALRNLAESVNRQGKINWDDRFGAGN